MLTTPATRRLSGHVVLAAFIAACSSSPTAPAPGAGKLFYVSNFNNNTVTAYTVGATGNAAPAATIAGSSSGLNGPTGIVRDNAGRLYVGNYYSIGGNPQSIMVYATSATGNATPVDTITGLNLPQGMAIAAGRLYVPNQMGSTISIFTVGPTGAVAFTGTISGSNTGLAVPLDVAVDAGGRLYVANVNNNTVTEYAAGATGNVAPTATIAGSATGLNVPTGIALDAAARIYVTNGGNNSITVYAAGASGNVTPRAPLPAATRDWARRLASLSTPRAHSTSSTVVAVSPCTLRARRQTPPPSPRSRGATLD